MKRLLLIVLSTSALVVAMVVFNPLSLLPAADVEPGPPARETGVVTVQDLTSTYEVTSASLTFAGATTITDPQPGTITWIAEPETELDPGAVLYERDQEPVVLLAGDVPAWRAMADGDVGADVAQLEANLLALGYGTEDEFTVDDTFTSATADIVERWQADLGVAETGRVAFGAVVFGPETARVGTVALAAGDQTNGQPLLVLSGIDRELTFEVDAATADSLGVGTVVEARLPDRSTIDGTVADLTPIGSGLLAVTADIAVGTGAGADDGGDATLPLGDEVPVTVDWSVVATADATAVPASAIVRLDDGHYAVEVVDGPGTTDLVPVEVGQRYGTVVEVVAGLEPGATVIAP